MSHSTDLRCERCGGQDIHHFFGRDARRRQVWRNRCGDCGLESEYLPTQSEIRRECLRIRCEQQLLDGGDDQEKFWRRAEAQRLEVSGKEALLAEFSAEKPAPGDESPRSAA